jgi:hypothetical protein
MPPKPCDAVDFLVYEETTLLKFPGSDAYFYVTEKMAIDADGAPNAYYPQDRGIDALANAGFPIKWPLTLERMEELAVSALTTIGGWERVLACVGPQPLTP